MGFAITTLGEQSCEDLNTTQAVKYKIMLYKTSVVMITTLSALCSIAFQEIWISIHSTFWTEESGNPGRIQDSEAGTGQPCCGVWRERNLSSSQ